MKTKIKPTVKKKNIIAIIPARGGSKGIPKKILLISAENL